MIIGCPGLAIVMGTNGFLRLIPVVNVMSSPLLLPSNARIFLMDVPYEMFERSILREVYVSAGWRQCHHCGLWYVSSEIVETVENQQTVLTCSQCLTTRGENES
jgi:hypothetical protein